MADTATTIADRPTIGSQPPALRSPADVLYANEIERSRVFVYLTTALSVVGILCVAVADADVWASRFLVGGCVVMFGVSMIGLWVLRDDARYTRGLAAAFGYVSVGVMMTAYYFFGWFSAVALLVPIGGITWGMGQRLRSVVAMAIAACGSHAALAGLQIAELIDDRSIAMIRAPDIARQLVFLGLAQMVFIASFWLGRMVHVHSLATLERYGSAVRDLARQEALLQEAHHDLDEARRVGNDGRLTGIVIGVYRLGPVIGRGAMGEVYDASHVETAEPAAVKVMSASGLSDERAVERFERELRVTAMLESPNIARVIAYSGADDGVKYLAMERLTGSTLSDELRRVNRMAMDDALAMVREVASGIDTAHAAGIVHRDLKPGNIFIDRAGDGSAWKILDFGVSKLVMSAGTLTDGGVIGTPQYMAPEQASGGSVDHRCDLFALGTIAYRALTGRPPFAGPNMANILYAVVHSAPMRPSLAAALPVQIDAVLAIAMAKDPAARFETAAQLSDALAAAATGVLSLEHWKRAELLGVDLPWREM